MSNNNCININSFRNNGINKINKKNNFNCNNYYSNNKILNNNNNKLIKPHYLIIFKNNRKSYQMIKLMKNNSHFYNFHTYLFQR